MAEHDRALLRQTRRQGRPPRHLPLFDGGRFRSTIDTARHRFGDGRYRYFEHPLPDTIAALRGAFYAHLAPVANAWSERIGGDQFPLTHEELLEPAARPARNGPRR
jgi:hypothetical protein